MRESDRSSLLRHIDDLLAFLNVAGEAEALNEIDFLILQKNLLLLKQLVLSFRPWVREILVNKTPRRSKSRLIIEAEEFEDKILEFIKMRKRVGSLDIFKAFSEESRKSIKRKISSLLKKGLINREIINNNQTVYVISEI